MISSRLHQHMIHVSSYLDRGLIGNEYATERKESKSVLSDGNCLNDCIDVFSANSCDWMPFRLMAAILELNCVSCEVNNGKLGNVLIDTWKPWSKEPNATKDGKPAIVVLSSRRSTKIDACTLVTLNTSMAHCLYAVNCAVVGTTLNTVVLSVVTRRMARTDKAHAVVITLAHSVE